MSRLVQIYPRAWRARYGDELEGLVAARPPGLGGSIDLVRGALDAHRHPELVDVTVPGPTGAEPVSRQRYEDLRVARRLGIVSWLGAVAWIFAWVVAANGPMVGTGDESYRDGGAAMPLYFAALLMLSAGLVGQMIRLPARARVARLGAFISILAAPAWGLGPWLLPFALCLLVGLLLLAIGAWWSTEWSGAAAVAVVGSTVAGALIIQAALGLGIGGPPGQAHMVAFVSLFTLVWLAVGANLQTLPLFVEDAPGTDDAATEAASA
jgi:hypothetical protein